MTANAADGSVELAFAGDLRRFRLGIAELIALQEARNSGPLEIATRLAIGTWLIQDITDTLRIGLIGALGENPPAAEAKKVRELVERTVQPTTLTTHALTARAVLLVALQGVPDDPVGKEGATGETPEADQNASPPPPSIATAS